LVSIVIPVLNGENYLSEAIESVLNQNYPNFEVIIGINPSSDRTLEIAKSFIGNKVIRIIEFEDKVNMPANFNRSGLCATGKYIRFLCHDDLLTIDSISDLVDVFEIYPSAIFAVGFEGFLENQRSIRGFSSFGSKKLIAGGRVLRRVIRYGNWIGGPSSVMILNSEFQNRQFSEDLVCSFDLDFWCHLAGKGNLAVSQNLNLLSRQHSDQATNQCTQGGFRRDNAMIVERIRNSKSTSTLNLLLLRIFNGLR
jgi:hypothetical protein